MKKYWGAGRRDNRVPDQTIIRCRMGQYYAPYRLFTPTSFSTSERYPLIVVLHGGGERGADDSIHIMAHPNATVWARDSIQAKQKCFIIAPQCPLNKTWCGFHSEAPVRTNYSISDSAENSQMKCVISLIDSMKKEFPIDSTRVYVCGMSLGGFGSFDAIMRHPNIFAAATPMCGGGDTMQVQNLNDVSIWMCHSNNDSTVHCVCSRQMITAFEKINRHIVFTNLLPNQKNGPNFSNTQMDSILVKNPSFLYSEYDGGDHQGGWRAWSPLWTWMPQYSNPLRGFDNPFLIRWMFAQKKSVLTSNRSICVKKGCLKATFKPGLICLLDDNAVSTVNNKVSPSEVFSLTGQHLGSLETLKNKSRTLAKAKLFIVK